MPWPPPLALDPFNFTGNPSSSHTADGQWEHLKSLARHQGVQEPNRQTTGATVASSVRGCTAISNEPNHCAGWPPLVTVPFREGIDDPRLSENPEGELGRKVMLMEEVGGPSTSELLSVSDWNDVEIEMVLDSGCCAHILDASQDAPGYPIKDSEGSRQGRGFIGQCGAHPQ